MYSEHHEENGGTRKWKLCFVNEYDTPSRSGCIRMCSRYHQEYKTSFQYLEIT